MATTDPVHDASEHGDKADKISDAIDAAEAALEREFMVLAASGNAAALEAFAPSHTYLDYNRGPSTVDLIQLVLNAASGRLVQADAAVLLSKMAASYARYNVDITAATEGLDHA